MWLKRTKAPSIKYFDMEEVSLAGFCNFCKNNLPLVLAVSITLFFAYGIRLFCNSIGIDTELFIMTRDAVNQWYLMIGRFGQVLLSSIWRIQQFNPFTSFFIAFCLIWVFTISWSYIIAIFSRNTGRNNTLIPFALVFMTVPVWAEQFYFLLQAAENAFIIALCPYVIYLMYKGFLNNEKGKIICAVLLLVLMISVYQPIVTLFICGVFICFILMQEQSNYKPSIYRDLCLKLFIALVSALAIYFIVDRIAIPAIFNIERAEYLDDMNQWGQKPAINNIRGILRFIYMVGIGHFSFVQAILGPILARLYPTGTYALEALHASVLQHIRTVLIPVALFFLIKIIAFMRKKLPAGRKFLYMLAAMGVPLSIILLAIMGGNIPPIRTFYALPLAYAFMFFYCIKSSGKKIAIAITCIAMFAAVYQAQVTAQLFHSDQMRYNEDVRITHKIKDMVMQIQPDDEELPVVTVGLTWHSSRLNANPSFLQGEVIGTSLLAGWFILDDDIPICFQGGLLFMRSLGVYFCMPNREQIIKAHIEAEFMPIFPAHGSVRRMDDFIVVKLSDDFHLPRWQELYEELNM